MNELPLGWPLVDERDDGIRPAGKPDECFYCRQKVGAPHGRECVVVTKRIEMQVTAKLPSGTYAGRWTLDEPYDWTPCDSEFHKNEGSWCSGNLLQERAKGSVVWATGDPWAELAALNTDDTCPCGRLFFEFLRVVDETPKRELCDRSDTRP